MLKLYRPIKSNLLTQKFGRENTRLDLLPLYEDFGMDGHNGFDLMADDNEPIYFNYSGRGKVIDTSADSAGGWGITIVSDDENGCYQYRFWHLKSFAVSGGDIVETGNLLGYADNTGISTGTHLHFDIKPLTKVSTGNYVNTYQTNGYYGAISPEPFWNNKFVVDYMKQLKSKVSLFTALLNMLKKLLQLKK